MKKSILLIVIMIFSIHFRLYGIGERSLSIAALNPVPVDSGLHILCYAGSSPLESLIWNPAYAVSKEYHLGVSYEKLLLNMYNGSLLYLGKSPFGENTGMGAVVKYFNSRDITMLDDDGEESGNFSINNFKGSFVFGYKFQSFYHMGFRFNFINEKIVGDTSTGISFDIGSGFDTSIFKVQKMTLGLTIINMGSKMWDEDQPFGIAGGILFEYPFSQSSSIEYGVGARWRSGMDYEAGPSLRYISKNRISDNKYFIFKTGVGYYFNSSVKENGYLNGLKLGLFIETPWRINIGYKLVFYPWGNGNQFYMG
ncbi:MAG: hypothetical protein KKH98_14405, partial [Spirochaetes bacterium]|nr:hypothetical protein [Spirochaetota bacterium]